MGGGNAGGGGGGKNGRKLKKRKSNNSIVSNSSDSSSGSHKNQKTPKSKCGPKRSKSRELRAGIFYMGCDCEKWNGLQDDCKRSECQGRPPCITRPPTCGPSQFSNGKHLMKKTALWKRKKAAFQAKVNDELYGNLAADGSPGLYGTKTDSLVVNCDDEEDDVNDDFAQYSGDQSNSTYLCFPYCMGMGYPTGCCCDGGSAGGDNQTGSSGSKKFDPKKSSSRETCGCSAGIK